MASFVFMESAMTPTNIPMDDFVAGFSPQGLPVRGRVIRLSGGSISPLVLCMFEGGEPTAPTGEQPESWLSEAPSTVQIFRRNLGKCALDDYELHRELLEAILWELMEFLGLNEEHLEQLGLGPRVADDPMDLD